MITIHTHQGKAVEIVLQSELRSPVDMGERVRAYCHIHGSDHQRSLSINKATGWGHCFNAACNATNPYVRSQAIPKVKKVREKFADQVKKDAK